MKLLQQWITLIVSLGASFYRFALLSLTVMAVPVWAQVEAEHSARQLRDPTRPLSYVEEGRINKPSGWRLDSVLISSQRKLAVINGKSVTENSWVRGAQVKRIQANNVVIVVKGKERVLKLRSGIRKTKVES